MAITKEDLAGYIECRKIWSKDIVAYSKARIGINPTKQQIQLFHAIVKYGAKVTVRAGHGVGKSSATAIIMLWHLETSEFSRTIATAPSSSQLYTVLWAELAKMIRKGDEKSKKDKLPAELHLSSLFELTQDKLFDKGAPKEWFALARTSRKETPDALQGFHASDIEIQEDGTAKHNSEGGGLLFVIEEASGVPDTVFEVAEGALSSEGARLLMIGNPTRNTGFFARSHKEDRSSYVALHFKCKDSPLPSNGYRAGLVRKYGENSNIVRVRADGEFPKQDDDVLISFELTEECLHQEAILDKTESCILGVDVARFGDDRTVLVVRQGKVVRAVTICSRQDTMVTVGKAIDMFKRYNCHSIFVDESGMGGGVVDRLKEQKYPVVGIDAASAAPVRKKGEQEQQGFKMRDCLWLEARDYIAEGGMSFALIDPEIARDLAAELSSVKYTFDSSGRIVVESKDHMKNIRKLRSPDIADAYNLTHGNMLKKPLKIDPAALARFGVRPNMMRGMRF